MCGGHARNPRIMQMIEDVNGYASNTGQCGDTIEIWLQVVNENMKKNCF